VGWAVGGATVVFGAAVVEVFEAVVELDNVPLIVTFVPFSVPFGAAGTLRGTSVGIEKTEELVAQTVKTSIITPEPTF
jgi:hypothetical protein